MAIPGWMRTESPFHPGELAIQTRLGVQEQIDKQGRRVIREFFPDQHRQFFAQLPYVIVGTVDPAGNPWASILVGSPGFLSTPNDQTLHVAAKPLFGDPLATTLADSIDIGLLGIELSTRRRNRLSGIVTRTGNDGFEVQVRQCFGNCPQYIQARQSKLAEPDPAMLKSVHSITQIGEPDRSIIAASDTFFIATAYQAKAMGSGASQLCNKYNCTM